MKPYYNSFMLITFLFLFSCNKIDMGYELGKDEYLKKIDINSEFIILIPDIQNYTSEKNNAKYLNTIIDRILLLRDYGFKIKAVLQVGDVTNYNSEIEWAKAREIFSKLDHKVPYIFCVGNHDYGKADPGSSRYTYFNKYFNYENDSSFISSFEKNNFENAFFKICIQKQLFHIFSLGFAPNDEIISWADSIAKSDEKAIDIVLTHAYLYKNRERFNFAKYGYNQKYSPYACALAKTEKINDGEEIWQKLIYPNNSIRFVFCGHMGAPDYIGNLISENSMNNECLQLLFDTQDFPNGGNGWIQILEFKNDLRSLKIMTYSALTNYWNTDSTSEYVFTYN